MLVLSCKDRGRAGSFSIKIFWRQAKFNSWLHYLLVVGRRMCMCVREEERIPLVLFLL